MHIKFFTRFVYGTLMHYPACEISKQICERMGVKTLTYDVRKILEILKVEMVEIHDPEAK